MLRAFKQTKSEKRTYVFQREYMYVFLLTKRNKQVIIISFEEKQGGKENE